MNRENVYDGMSVTGKRGSGVLVRNVNGWDVKLNDGTVMQSIDFNEWEPAPKKEVRRGVDPGKRFG